MESKKGKKFNFKIGGIVAIAVVAAIVGTLAFTSYETNSDSNTNTQSIGIGAFVTVEVFNEDGDLSHTWEGHNALTEEGRNFIARCITGINSSNCPLSPNDIQFKFHGGSTSFSITTLDATMTLTPDGCLGSFDCTGWKLEQTLDYSGTFLPDPCESGVDCVVLDKLFSGANLNPFLQFNVIDVGAVEPPVPFVPNDRLVITMNFEIPE